MIGKSCVVDGTGEVRLPRSKGRSAAAMYLDVGSAANDGGWITDWVQSVQPVEPSREATHERLSPGKSAVDEA